MGFSHFTGTTWPSGRLSGYQYSHDNKKRKKTEKARQAQVLIIWTSYFALFLQVFARRWSHSPFQSTGHLQLDQTSRQPIQDQNENFLDTVTACTRRCRLGRMKRRQDGSLSERGAQLLRRFFSWALLVASPLHVRPQQQQQTFPSLSQTKQPALGGHKIGKHL